APLHHGGIHGVRTPDPAGADLHQRLDSPSRRQKVAETAPLNLFQRHCRSDPLSMAGESGYSQAAAVWVRARSAAHLSDSGMDATENPGEEVCRALSPDLEAKASMLLLQRK